MYLEVKSSAKSLVADLILSVSAFFHSSIFLLGGLDLEAFVLVWMKTQSLSLTPGMALHLSIRVGRLVINRSRVLSFLVGK